MSATAISNPIISGAASFLLQQYGAEALLAAPQYAEGVTLAGTTYYVDSYPIAHQEFEELSLVRSLF